MEATAGSKAKANGWRMFTVGLSVRLLGLLLIWLGDGSSHWFRIAVVIVGVILSVGGIAVLRYMLMAPLLTKLFGK